MNWLYTLIFTSLAIVNTTTTKPESAAYVSSDAVTLTKPFAEETEKIEKTFGLTANGRVTVSNVNGSVTIAAWDKNEVKLVAIKSAPTKELLQQLNLKIEDSPDSLSVKVEQDRSGVNNKLWKDGAGKVEFQIMVPSGAQLAGIETVNGSVSVSGVTNVTNVSIVNGTIKINEVKGNIQLSLVNGEINCDLNELLSGSRIQMSTVNGQIDLKLPSDANTTLQAETLNGRVSNGFGLKVNKGAYVGRNMKAKLGSGDSSVELESVNGDLNIARQQDGRSLQPTQEIIGNDGDEVSRNFSAATDRSRLKIKAAADAANAAAGKSAAEAERAAALAELQTLNSEKFKKELAKISPDAVRSLEKARAGLLDIPFPDMDVARRAQTFSIRSADLDKLNIRRSEKTIEVNGTPKLTVNAEGYNIRINGWDRSEVKYIVTGPIGIGADSPMINEKVDGRSITLNVGEAEDDFPLMSAPMQKRIDIFVPRKADIKVKTGNEIRIQGVKGELDLQGENENIELRDVDGIITAVTDLGRIRGIGVSGRIIAKSESGGISIEGSLLNGDIRSYDGEVTLTLPENLKADIVSESPHIDVFGLSMQKTKLSDESNVYHLAGGDPDRVFKIITDGAIVLRNLDSLAVK